MYWRIALATVLVLLLAGTHWKAYHTGMKVIRAEMQEVALKAEQAARQREKELLAQRDNVEKRYANEKRKAAAAAVGAQSELDRLRGTLAASGGATCNDPAAAARAYAGTRLEADLLGRCAATLVGVAEDADRLAAQVIGLQGYVKDVCLKAN